MPYYHFPERCLELRFSKSVICLLESALACKTFWPKLGQCLAEPALKHSIPGRWSWAHSMWLLFSPRFGQATHGSAIKPQILSEFSHWKTFHEKLNKFTLKLLKPEPLPFFSHQNITLYSWKLSEILYILVEMMLRHLQGIVVYYSPDWTWCLCSGKTLTHYSWIQHT